MWSDPPSQFDAGNKLGRNAEINLQNWWNQICEAVVPANDNKNPGVQTPEESLPVSVPDDDCREEIKHCAQLCSEAQIDPDASHIYWGSIMQCMRNCLPERCGGEPKWKGWDKPRKPRKKKK